uniref:Uncharacterized protein n=1 Tax=Pundamilia nyererei TaxID=303518 RepID=A0A3B4FB27_9CICH
MPASCPGGRGYGSLHPLADHYMWKPFEYKRADPHRCAHGCSLKSYGDVYSIYIGLKPAVIINGMKAIKEAIVTKATDFAGRPQDLFVSDITKRKGTINITCNIRHVM